LVFATVALVAAGSASAGETPADSQQDWRTALRMPGPDHERLNALIGEWTMAVRYWGHPEDEAVELRGSATSQWTLDGRFVEERAENGTSQGTRYESIGYLGYDRQAKLYERFWMTNSSTAISSERGRYDPDENVIRMEGSEVAPGSGAVILTASELKIESPSRHVVTAYATGADGVRWKQLEIVYTKK
jgi:Protein of unknown function (DUF1579)